MKKFITSQIRINVSPDKIIEALVDPEQLHAWWGVDDAFVEKKDGGLYCLTWMRTPEGIKFISSGQIRLYNPRSHLYLENLIYINYEKPMMGPFTLKYDVFTERHYSILKINQSGFQKGLNDEWDWYYNAVLDGWPQALVILKNYLERRYV